MRIQILILGFKGLTRLLMSKKVNNDFMMTPPIVNKSCQSLGPSFNRGSIVVITECYRARATTNEGQDAFAPTLCFA